MPASDDHNTVRNLGTVHGSAAPASDDLVYMHRRRIGTADRNGDPLDGIVNLFDVAIVLAVGFLLAALTGIGMSDLLTSENMTIVTNPGTPEMQVVVKNGDQIERLDLQTGAQVTGLGTLLGSFYRLADGTVVYVPAGTVPPPGSSAVPGTTPTPYPSATATPYPTVAPTVTPDAGSTITPDTRGAPATTPTPTGAPGIDETPAPRGG
jgi:hypothetical protein